MIPKGLEKLPIQQWTNKHENFTQDLVPDSSFKVYNPSGESRRERYHKTTKNFQWLIKHGIDNHIRLRAMGSGWSFTKVGVTEGGLIDTASLNFSFLLTRKYVATNYPHQVEDLYFLQCGSIIYEINNRLATKNPARSIKASGASNGQTIAGALSTGTHGAAFEVGAIQDFVVGLHIITGPNEHVWLERASYPVAAPDFVDWLDAKIIKDDALFEAALVSFGSFGFIHGVMIETEPVFLLEEHRKGDIPYNDVLKKAMTQLDFSDLNLPGAGPNKELYHFEVLFNLHKFEKNNPNKGAFLKYMYKKPYQLPYTPVVRDNNFTYGDDLLGIMSATLDRLGVVSDLLIPPMVNTMFGLAFAPQPPQTGTIRELFNYTKFRGKVASAAIGIDIANAAKVVEEIIDVNKNTPFPGGLSLRYVKGTKATLGFTKFPHTCVLEIDGVDSNAARDFYEAVWNRLEDKNIPYTLHWGKINFNLNKTRIKNMYGTANVNAWIDARNTLLSNEVAKVFTNKFIERCGLDTILGPIV